MPFWPWIERTFHFDFPVGKYPDLMERLRGTPARVEDRIRGLSPGVLRWSDGGWSILQNIGHLIDLEYLPDRRLDELLAGHAMLTAAEMSNRQTIEAGHNQRDPGALTRELRAKRSALCARFDGLSPEQWAFSAIHPRLKQPMRMVDLVYFTCEHDDYHLARIGELARKAPRTGPAGGG